MALALAGAAFDPSLAHSGTIGSFTLVEPMKQFRRQQTATLLLDGRVLIAGGAPFFQAAVSELYNPVTGSWTNSGSLATGREFHTATLLQDGRVVVTGGQTTSQLLSSTEVYDPPSGQWVGAGVLNEARESHDPASAVAAPFLLSQPTKLQTGAIQFTFRNTPGLDFTVLSTTNLGVHLDNWTSPGIATEVSPGHYQFTDVTPDSPQRFYGVRSP